MESDNDSSGMVHSVLFSLGSPQNVSVEGRPWPLLQLDASLCDELFACDLGMDDGWRPWFEAALLDGVEEVLLSK